MLTLVVLLAAGMVWHVERTVRPADKLWSSEGVPPGKSKDNTATRAEPAPASRPSAKPAPRLPFDEASVMMPPEMRKEYDQAANVLQRAFGRGAAVPPESCLRHPEITIPRILLLPASRKPVPAMPLQIGPKFGVSGRLLLTTMRLTDGTHRPVAMEKKDGAYRIDWESLVGWCEKSFTELLARPEAKAVLLRVHCRPSSARAPYAHESGMALTLSHPTEKGTLSVFVPHSLLSASEEGKTLAMAREAPFTLRVMADASHAGQGWARVTEVVSTGWLTDK